MKIGSLIFVLLFAFSLTTKAEDFNSVKLQFDQGVEPEDSSLLGWFSGECYDTGLPYHNPPRPGLLAVEAQGQESQMILFTSTDCLTGNIDCINHPTSKDFGSFLDAFASHNKEKDILFNTHQDQSIVGGISPWYVLHVRYASRTDHTRLVYSMLAGEIPMVCTLGTKQK